jgi:DNA-binding NarL/FixJ family response regulator
VSLNVVVADRHTLIRYGLRELLGRYDDIAIAGDCTSGAEAADLVRTARTDVIVMDTILSDGDGLAFARQLRERHSGLGIVIVTAQEDDAVLFRAAEAGASALVTKTAPAEEVIVAVKHAAMAPTAFSAAGLAAALARRNRTTGRPFLSPREAEVLLLLCEGLSVPAVAQKMHISRSTAKSYVARLYQKLSATNRAQALMTAVRYGLIGDGPELSLLASMLPLPRSGDMGAMVAVS